jgi:RimJ/RimL family protein N-acetyltransferase
MMAHLGGAWPKERMPQKLRDNLAHVEAGTAWIFKIIADEDSNCAAGSVCIWENSWQGERINEIGWMILPSYQGRGLGAQAVRAILDKAQSERRWDVIHAFPGISNTASNSICRKMGFSMIEECAIEWAGHILQCNHWRLDLRSQAKIA